MKDILWLKLLAIAKERRPVAFTEDEQLLYDKTFSALSPQQFKRLLAIGEWQELDREYVLHSTGDKPHSLEAVVPRRSWRRAETAGY